MYNNTKVRLHVVKKIYHFTIYSIIVCFYNNAVFCRFNGRIGEVKKIENPNSLDIFRMQEVERFNILIKVMKKSLSDLQKAIKGTVVMSITLENMFSSFLDKKVP